MEPSVLRASEVRMGFDTYCASARLDSMDDVSLCKVGWALVDLVDSLFSVGDVCDDVECRDCCDELILGGIQYSFI